MAVDTNTATAVGEEPSSSISAVATNHSSRSVAVDINTAEGDESSLVIDWPTVDLSQSTTRDDFAPTLEDVVLSFGETTTHDPQDSVCDVATPSPRFTTLKTPKRTSHTSATTSIIPSTPHPSATTPIPSTPHTSASPHTSATSKRKADSDLGSHAKIRKFSGEQFLKSANRQQIQFDRKKGAMASDYLPGDTVGVRVPKVDRTNMSQKIMPCKVLEKTHDKYKVYSKCGILKAAFGHCDLIDMRNMNFDILKDLDHSSLTAVSFTKAAKVHSGFVTKAKGKGGSLCNCKGKCVNNKYSCNSIGAACSANCHPGNMSCVNK